MNLNIFINTDININTNTRKNTNTRANKNGAFRAPQLNHFRKCRTLHTKHRVKYQKYQHPV